MSVPASRALATVLREAVATDLDKVELVVGTAAAPILAGPEGTAYINVTVGGTTVKVPRLRDSGAVAVGEPVYLLVTRNFMLSLGTVKTT